MCLDISYMRYIIESSWLSACVKYTMLHKVPSVRVCLRMCVYVCARKRAGLL